MADIEVLMPLIKQFMPFAQERMGFQDPPRLFLKGDSKNASNPLGRTAYYDPAEKAITLYVTDRHPKDVMRSLSHELVHHMQCCNGDFKNSADMGPGYAQSDPHMREMERQAYEMGNMCFRDWEDSIKQTIYFEHLQKGDKTMSTKDWKNKEIKSLLSEAWGFKMDLSKLNESTEENLEEGGCVGNRDTKDGETCPKCGKVHASESVNEEQKCPHCEGDAPKSKCICGKKNEAVKAEGETIEEGDEELDEKRARGRKDARHVDGRGDDERKRPGDLSESLEKQIRIAVRKAIKDAMK